MDWEDASSRSFGIMLGGKAQVSDVSLISSWVCGASFTPKSVRLVQSMNSSRAEDILMAPGVADLALDKVS
jgi:hypothetical protein